MPTKSRRAPIKAAIKHLLNDQCDSACAVCRETSSSKLEIHHIDGDTQNPELENLLLVCSGCHSEFTIGTKSEADARTFKRMAELGCLSPRKGTQRQGGVTNHGINQGMMADKIHIEKYISTGGGKATTQIRPGTIGASAIEHNYIEYLIEQLSKFRNAGASYGQRFKSKVHPGSIKSQLRNEFGALPKDLPLDKYFGVREHLRMKIDGTILGKTNRSKGIANYHSEEDHIIQRSKRSKR